MPVLSSMTDTGLCSHFKFAVMERHGYLWKIKETIWDREKMPHRVRQQYGKEGAQHIRDTEIFQAENEQLLRD